MRILPLFALFAAGLLAQVAAPPPQNPAVPPVPPVVGQQLMGRPQPGTPVQPVSPDTVVAKLNDKPLTAADVDKMLGDFPTQIQVTHHTRAAKIPPATDAVSGIEQRGRAGRSR